MLLEITLLVGDSFSPSNQITSPNMGQSKSRSQNTEPVQFVPIQLPIKQDPIFLARGKLSDESEIKISTETDGLFKNLFVWKEESNCDDSWGYIVFVDRSF